jgi:hypothetical protein
MHLVLPLLLTLAATPAQHVVVVVSDGLRAREVFEGAERALMGRQGGVECEDGLVEKYWRPTAEARRAALMPFLWGTMAREGQLLGSAGLGSPLRVSNPRRLSYPGYNELFTGVADPRIDSNAYGENPNTTVLEWLSRQPGFEGRVQVFATWETFFRIFAVGRSGLDVRAGMEPPFAADPERTPLKDSIDGFYRATTPVFGGNALDSFTELALEASLEHTPPRVLFVGLGETDEWMHAGRYDLALEAAHRADGFLRHLWEKLQSMPEYRGTTALIVTTDHGRGLGAEDWKDHGAEVAGSEDIWLAAMGPGVPALGERSHLGPSSQAQVASTIAELLGFDWHTERPDAAPALRLAPGLSARR